MESAIRPWRPEDAPALAAILDNKEILDSLRDGIPYPYTRRDAEAYISEMLASDPLEVYAFAIVENGVLTGGIGAFRQENIHCRSAELGYYVGEPYWGRGLATRAVKDLCRLLFRTTNLLRIFAEPFARNTASCRVLEKAGFQLEGVLRANAVKNGEVLDMKLYARLKE